ncbi:MAG: hypothetical protein GXP63_03170 [DPANN group archaeon]|nr:hypothetical protein [DPANN group archaeon]
MLLSFLIITEKTTNMLDSVIEHATDQMTFKPDSDGFSLANEDFRIDYSASAGLDSVSECVTY